MADLPTENHSVRRLNQFARALGCRSYLEIGVEGGNTFLQVEVADKTGVDPHFQFDWLQHHGKDQVQLHPCASDTFFASLDLSRQYDLIFVDGLHTYEQTYRDILHAIRHGHGRSVIVIDDTVPCDVFSTCRDQQQAINSRLQFTSVHHLSWHGDTYKVIPLLTAFHPDLRMVTLMDGGNPQTVLWRPLRPEPEDGLRTMQAMWAVQNLAAADYMWFLENFSLYNPVGEEDGLRLVIESLS